MKHKYITEPMEKNLLVDALLDEIEYIYSPLFEHIYKQNYQITPDHFNPIRILMPLLELTSKIEYKGEVVLLLEKLEVPKPDLIWLMFRNGLLHYVRPFYAIVNGKRIGWAVPQYECQHYSTDSSLGLYAPKLLKDLKNYLEEIRYKSFGTVEVQTGIELFCLH